MHPSKFSLLIIVLLGAACVPPGVWMPADPGRTPPSVSIISHREYKVVERIILENAGPGRPEKQNLWVALIRSLPPYQEVRQMTAVPDDYALVTDEYGNRFAEFDLSQQPPGTTRSVEIRTQVVVNELAYDLSECEGELPGIFLQPELHIESANPQIIALAHRLAGGRDTVCQKVRAFYDYEGDELTYTYNGANWGAQAALGPMGADCTEYAALLVALSRAEGIPARYFEGLRYLRDDPDPQARVEHAWADVYMPGAGWMGIDPTLGRVPVNREDHFAHYTPDHIIITLGPNPSTLRGGSYWTHLYWPGDAARISVRSEGWKIELTGGQD